ncbi:MAG: DUF1566 domain-containing protein [Nitrospirales bacterium]
MKKLYFPISHYLGFVMVGTAALFGLFITSSHALAQNNGQSPQAMLSQQQTDLANDHHNLSIDHTGLDQKLNQILETMQSMGVNSASPLCGAGTQTQRFVSSGDGSEVCDNTTGLYWEQSPSSLSFTHDTALAHCLALGGGYRLPEIKELGSLIDYSVGDQAAFHNAGAFAGIFSNRYRTATPVVGFPATHWSGSFMNGSLVMAFDGQNFPAWCVR